MRSVCILLTPTLGHEPFRLREQFWETTHDELGHDCKGLERKVRRGQREGRRRKIQKVT